MTHADISDWEAILAATTRVEVHPVALDGGDVPMSERIEVSEPDAVRELTERLEVAALAQPPAHTMGQVQFRLSGAEGDLATVVLHDGAALRWDRWDQEGTIARGHRLVAWLARNGISLSALVAAKLKDERARKGSDREAWIAAIPKCLGELAPHMFAIEAHGAIPERFLDEAATLLARGIPDDGERHAALFAWSGEGTGLLTGYPVREGIPHELLKRAPVGEILANVGAEAPDSVRLGAARHLAGHRRPEELVDVEPERVNVLVAYAEEAGQAELAEALRQVSG